MTGKERFAAVMAHKTPDKFPLYIPTVACSVASALLGRPVFTGADSLHFQEELHLAKGEAAHREFVDKMIEDTVELLRHLRVDIVRQTWRSREKPTKQLDAHTLLFGDENGYYRIKRFFPETQTYGVIKSTYPAQRPEDVEAGIRAFLDEPDSLPTVESVQKSLVDPLRLFDKMKDLQLGEIVPGGELGLGMTNPAELECAILEPELLHAYFMKQCRSEIAEMHILADMGYTWMNGGNDMASNMGPAYSPKLFDAIVAEPLRLFADACRARGVVFCYRTDGNMWPVFDSMFNKAGVQAYGEVDRDAGMSVGKIRAANDDLLILGNMSSAFLVKASVAEVREETRIQLEEAAGKNFIPGPSNAVVHGTPPENLMAMVEEIERFGNGK